MLRVSEKELKETEERFLSCDAKSSSASVPTSPPKKKRKGKAVKHKPTHSNIAMAELAASLQVDHFKRVFQDWSEIALIIRNSRFEEDEDQKIDIYEIKCKLWGQLLLHLFGVTLGTGDYGHLTINHSAMLFRTHRSFVDYSNQGFEASHKVHRSIYSRATNHDQQAVSQSVDQILTHWLAEMMLCLRLQFLNAQKCIDEGKLHFYFRGCGWQKKLSNWDENEKKWIAIINSLFNSIFGKNCAYVYSKEKGTSVTDDFVSTLKEYNHGLWEKEYVQQDGISHEDHTAFTPPPSIKKQKVSEQIVSMPKISTSNHIQSCQASVSANFKPSSNITSSMLSNAHTRGQLAALFPVLPPVKPSLKPTCVMAVNSIANTTDPYTLSVRPSEAVIKEAELVLQKGRALGVHIPGVGTFTEDGIAVLSKFCDVANTAWKVSQESDWLVHVGCTNSEHLLISDALWNKATTFPLLKRGGKVIDILSFSDLAQERYIDNFVIDVCISQYIEESKTDGQTTLYLPPELSTWMETNNEEFQRQKLISQTNAIMTDDLSQLVMPVYMTKHWGLVYIDLINKNLYFDDGMKVSPPVQLLPSIKRALDLLSKIYPTATLLKQEFWHSFASFSQFGMPSQTPVDSRMIGIGSCGIGVIMAAKDFIKYGPGKVNNIRWRYCDMHHHRKDLMLQILAWNTAS